MTTTGISLAAEQLLIALDEKKKQVEECIVSIRKAQLMLSDDSNIRLDDLKQEATTRRNGHATIYERICEYQAQHDNTLIQAGDLASKLESKPHCVRNVLYQTHEEMFEKEPMPGYKKKLLWRLKDEAMAAYLKNRG